MLCRGTRLLGLFALLLSSCSGGEYSIVVRFDTQALADQVDRVEVYLVSACGALDTTGAEPASPEGRLDLRRGATTTTFSAVAAGSYGLYARGYDGATCQVIAAGCESVTLEAGGSGELVVTLSMINGPLCPTGMPCRDGVCGVDDGGMPDGGMDAAMDAPMDTAVPCSCVPCASCDDAGVCIADNSACGAGMYCDLVTGCTAGDPCTTDTECIDDGNPCTTTSCDTDLGICVANAVMDGTSCTDDAGRDGRCRASTCCTGCWDGGACVAGDDVASCGLEGARCTACDDGNACTTDTCSGGSCGGTPTSGACPGGTCTAGTCCTGCLSGDACEPGDTAASCGTGGARCASCDTAACPPERCTGSGCMPLGATSVDGRRLANFAIAPDNSLWAWGENGQGQLGVGGGGSRDVPTQVGGDTDWAQVSAGRTHACAVKTTGQLFCWGNGANGRLGLGSLADYDTPQRVGTESDWAMVTCGEPHTCAIKTDGTLWCWGGGLNGTGGPTSVPARVGSETDWSMVDTRSLHTCGIRGGGLLYCWGDDEEGQLGIGDEGGRSAAPARVGVDADWMTVAAAGSPGSGGGWTCALKTDGSRWCWGENGFFHRYGDPTTSINTDLPRRIDAGPWRIIALGSTHGCAIAMDRSLHCWGDNSDDATGGADSVTEMPTMVGSATDYTSVAAASTTTCTVRSTGELHCFGQNSLGQLGRPGGASASPVRACL